MTSTDRKLLQELNEKHRQLQSFRGALNKALRSRLDQCEWSLILYAGDKGLPLLAIRLPSRVLLNDPFLTELAAQAEVMWGPVDFALFSGEVLEPVRVLSQTLLDRRWWWHS